MSLYLGILPILVLMVYGLVQFIYRSSRSWWQVFLILAAAAGMWYAVHFFCDFRLTNLVMLVVLELFFFELLQVRHRKMSLLFHSLFYLAAAVTAVSAVVFPESIVAMQYLLVLIYFLTESNQRYLKKTFEESATVYQNQLLTKQVNEVQNIYMTMRGWRHDYHNHLQTLKAHLMLCRTEEAKAYLDNLEEDLDHINNLIETGNVNVDAILNSKLSLALKDEIEVNYKAEVPEKAYCFRY